jgi:hypothetical protein
VAERASAQDGSTALHLAAESGNTSTAIALIRLNAAIDLRDKVRCGLAQAGG